MEEAGKQQATTQLAVINPSFPPSLYIVRPIERPNELAAFRARIVQIKSGLLRGMYLSKIQSCSLQILMCICGRALRVKVFLANTWL